MTARAIDAQGPFSELPTSSARQRHPSTRSLMAHPSTSILYNKDGHRKAKRDLLKGRDVTCGHCICRPSTNRLWKEAEESWRTSKAANYSEHIARTVCVSCRGSYSRRNIRTCNRVCQASRRPKHVDWSPAQTSTSHPHL